MRKEGDDDEYVVKGMVMEAVLLVMSVMWTCKDGEFIEGGDVEYRMYGKRW